MRIRFSKSRHGPVLVCVRDDGSVTGMKNARHGEFFVRHDLMHYAVEGVLDFREAFYGLLASGRSIQSFNVPGGGKALPEEAVLTEFIVGAIDRRLMFGEPVEAAAINGEIAASLAANGGPTSNVLTQASLDEIVERFTAALTRYQGLAVGEHIDLPFPARMVARAG